MSGARPRPRPKPKPKAAIVSSDGSQPSSSTNLKEEDKLFMRNLGPPTAPKPKPKGEKKPRKVSHERQATESPTSKSDWRNQKNFRLLSVELSDDDSGDELQIIDDDDTPTRLKRKRPDERKRKERARSKSLTPPPVVPAHQLQTARDLIKRALSRPERQRSVSPTVDFEGDSSDSLALDPELQAIAKRLRSDSSKFADRRSSLAPEDDEKVILNVKWKHHPLTTDAAGNIWSFKLNRTDSFHDLFDAVSEESHVFPESLIMTYDGQRFYPSVTPHTLRIWGEANIIACEDATYEYLRKLATQRRSPSPPNLPPPQKENHDSEFELLSDEGEHPEDSPPFPTASVEDSGARSDGHRSEPEAEDDTFKIILRSARSKEITLTVRPTTKCGAIVRAFLKKAGLAEAYPDTMNAGGDASPKKKRKTTAKTPHPQICVDGDRVADSEEIGGQDLEDGDMIEIVGLD